MVARRSETTNYQRHHRSQQKSARFFFLKDSFGLLDPERQAQNELRRASEKSDVFLTQKVLYYFIRRKK
jgi:hypothetical protein